LGRVFIGWGNILERVHVLYFRCIAASGIDDATVLKTIKLAA
jgi:hypothetical protein